MSWNMTSTADRLTKTKMPLLILFLKLRSKFNLVKEKKREAIRMGRGVSAGGGQSSLGYLFGSGETAPKSQGQTTDNVSSQKPTVTSPPIDKQIPAGIPGNHTNNYYRADGQNCGNFITDRPSTKVRAAPGGDSSLGYLFGGGGN